MVILKAVVGEGPKCIFSIFSGYSNCIISVSISFGSTNIEFPFRFWDFIYPHQNFVQFFLQCDEANGLGSPRVSGMEGFAMVFGDFYPLTIVGCLFIFYWGVYGGSDWASVNCLVFWDWCVCLVVGHIDLGSSRVIATI